MTAFSDYLRPGTQVPVPEGQTIVFGDRPPVVHRHPTTDDIGKRFLAKSKAGNITMLCINAFSPSGKFVFTDCEHAHCVGLGWCRPEWIELLEEMPIDPVSKCEHPIPFFKKK